jgi:hypothetical protein
VTRSVILSRAKDLKTPNLRSFAVSAAQDGGLNIYWNFAPREPFENRAMEKPARRTLLPGVTESGPPPDVVFESRRVIASARRRAVIPDVFDLLLLASVDALFLRWPHAHVPMFGRDGTMLVLLGANALLIAYLWYSRAVPRWRAKRLAATWSASERNRFVRP